MVILRALNSFGSLLIRALLFWFGLCVSFRSIRLMHCFVFVGAVVVCDFTQPYMSVCKPKCRACVCMCVAMLLLRFIVAFILYFYLFILFFPCPVSEPYIGPNVHVLVRVCLWVLVCIFCPHIFHFDTHISRTEPKLISDRQFVGIFFPHARYFEYICTQYIYYFFS